MPAKRIDRIELARLYNAGVKIREIAVMMESTRESIAVILSQMRKAGLIGGRREQRGADIAEIVRLHNAGSSHAEIATALGMTPGSVGHALMRARRNGIYVKTNAERIADRPKEIPRHIRNIIAMFHEGLPYPEIAEKIGFPGRQDYVANVVSYRRRRGDDLPYRVRIKKEAA